MFCMNCGAKLQPGQKFCAMCGTRVPIIENQQPAPEAQPEPVQPVAAPEPEPVQPVVTPEPEPVQPVAQPKYVQQPVQQQPVYQQQNQNAGNATPPLDIVSGLKQALKNVTNFDGRARRSEFWWWSLAVTVVAVVVAFIPYLRAIAALGWSVFMAAAVVRRLHDVEAKDIISKVFIATSLVFSIINGMKLLAEFDEVYSLERAFYGSFGDMLNLLYCACGIVAVVALILVVVFAVKDSLPSDNQWGQNPKMS